MMTIKEAKKRRRELHKEFRRVGGELVKMNEFFSNLELPKIRKLVGKCFMYNEKESKTLIKVLGVSSSYAVMVLQIRTTEGCLSIFEDIISTTHLQIYKEISYEKFRKLSSDSISRLTKLLGDK